jgi:hypothetical protein
LFVKVDERGVCTIQGPNNVNGRIFRMTTAGIQEQRCDHEYSRD